MGDKEQMIHIYYMVGQNILIKASLVNNILGTPGESGCGLLCFTDLNMPDLSVQLHLCFQAP